MIVDTYKECPCGSGKRVKFCCSADITSDLEKVLRSMAGDQRRAALDQIERTIAAKGPRAALLVLQANLQLNQRDFAGHQATVRTLLEVAPNNPIGLAFSALLRLSEGAVSDAVDELQRAIEVCGERLPETVYALLGEVGRGLIASGFLIAGRAHLELQSRIEGEFQEQARHDLEQLDATVQIPALMKQPFELSSPPAGVPWESSFQAALKLARQGIWAGALARFVELAQSAPEDAAIMRNIAVLCGWLGNHPLSIGAWRKYAGLNGVSSDDAIEAETIALILDGILAADALSEVEVIYEVSDFDAVSERLMSDRAFARYDGDYNQFAEEGQPPPRGVFSLSSEPSSGPSSEPTSESGPTNPADYPFVTATVLLFGKETDRPARIALNTIKDDHFAAVLKKMVDIVGVTAVPAEEITGQIGLLNYYFSRQFRQPKTAGEAEAFRQAVQNWPRHFLFKLLPERNFSLFGGKTLRAAVADPALQRAAQALVTIIAVHGDVSAWDIEWQEYFQQIGLPIPGAIDPRTIPDAEFPFIRCTRWARLVAEQLHDEQLLFLVKQSVQLSMTRSSVRFARELQSRPGLSQRPERIIALRVLAATVESEQESLQMILSAAELIAASKASPAKLLLTAMTMFLRRGFTAAFQSVFSRIRSRHMNEPGVAQSLYQLLMAIGAITPDGKAVDGPESSLAITPAASSPSVSEGIWTPEVAATTESKSKLWLPGMD